MSQEAHFTIGGLHNKRILVMRDSAMVSMETNSAHLRVLLTCKKYQIWVGYLLEGACIYIMCQLLNYYASQPGSKSATLGLEGRATNRAIKAATVTESCLHIPAAEFKVYHGSSGHHVAISCSISLKLAHIFPLFLLREYPSIQTQTCRTSLSPSRRLTDVLPTWTL